INACGATPPRAREIPQERNQVMKRPSIHRAGLRSRSVLALMTLALALAAGKASAQAPVGSAFTYQGELKNNGTPVVSPSDMQFRLFDTPTGGMQIGTTLSAAAMTISSGGRFTIDLDF